MLLAFLFTFIIFQMQRTTSPASNSSSLHHVPVESEKEGHARTVAGYIQKGALSDKDVSYLAFKAVDINSISGTPSPRKNTSTNSNAILLGLQLARQIVFAPFMQ